MRSLLCFTLLSLLTLSHCQLTTTCQTSSDCPSSRTCEQNVCVRENLFPLYPKEVLATFISVVINVFLNIGGVGGGAVHIPYIHLLYEVTMDKAVTISFACVFGASLAYVFCTVPIKDAPTNRYLINYDISLIALPALMVGVGVGSIVTRFFSPLMTSIFIVFVLGYAILKNAFKFKAAMSKEIFVENGGRRRAYQVSDAHSLEVKPKAKVVDVRSVELAPPSIQEVMSKNDLPEQEQGPVKEEESSQEEDSSKDENSVEEQDEVPSPIKLPEPGKRQPAKNLLNKRNSLPASLISLGSATTFDRTYSRVLSIIPNGKDNAPLAVNDQIIELPLDMVSNKAEQLSGKEKNFPVKKLLSLLINVLSIVIFGVIRGTKNFKSIFGVQWSLTWDLIWFSLGTLCFCLATIKSIYDVLKSQKEKQEAKYEFLPHEPILTRQTIKALLIRAVIGGFASAVSTLAGAFILGPALGDMGMPAPFVAATTNMIMILSMFNAMLAILLNGSLSIEETIWFMFFSALLGMTVVRTLNGYVKKTGRESTVIGMIIIGTIIGVMCLISTTMQSLMENLPGSMKFGSYYPN